VFELHDWEIYNVWLAASSATLLRGAACKKEADIWSPSNTCVIPAGAMPVDFVVISVNRARGPTYCIWKRLVPVSPRMKQLEREKGESKKGLGGVNQYMSEHGSDCVCRVRVSKREQCGMSKQCAVSDREGLSH